MSITISTISVLGLYLDIIVHLKWSDRQEMNPKMRVRTIVIIAFVTVFFDTMNNALIVPVLPFLLTELGSTSMQEGILFSSYSIFNLSVIKYEDSFPRFIVYGSS